MEHFLSGRQFEAQILAHVIAAQETAFVGLDFTESFAELVAIRHGNLLMDLVPVRGYAKGWTLPFSAIAAWCRANGWVTGTYSNVAGRRKIRRVSAEGV